MEAPVPFVPIARRPIAYVDTETSGLDPETHEILDVAVVFDIDVALHREIDGITLRDDVAFFSTKVRPTRIETAHPKALEVNGYSAHPERWANAPTFDEVAPKVAALLKDAVICGHNPKFDVGFIEAALRRAGVEARLDYHAIDTCVLAYEHLVPCGLERISLDSVREFLGWPKDNAHTALQDALDARKLHKWLSRATFIDRAIWRWRRRARVQRAPAGA